MVMHVCGCVLTYLSMQNPTQAHTCAYTLTHNQHTQAARAWLCMCSRTVVCAHTYMHTRTGLFSGTGWRWLAPLSFLRVVGKEGVEQGAWRDALSTLWGVLDPIVSGPATEEGTSLSGPQ
jgi:hypothetical protein